tara:strand:+ start:1856 stop:2668 length:813 start_codon:yes stop_codon:yes gene_type:complete
MTRAAYARPFGGADGGGGGGGATDPVWTRYLLNSATKSDPGGGATLTVNSESGAGYTDISQAKVNETEPKDLTSFSIQLFKADGTTPITWADNFVIRLQLIVNQYTTDDDGAGQSLCPFVSNAAVPTTTAHRWMGLGTYTYADDVKVLRLWPATGAVAPDATTLVIQNNVFSQQFRYNFIFHNTVQRGMYFALAEYREFDNSAKQSAWLDIEGLDADGSGRTAWYAPNASDPVFLGFFVPGLNAAAPGRNMTNSQFKLFYHVAMLPQSAV